MRTPGIVAAIGILAASALWPCQSQASNFTVTTTDGKSYFGEIVERGDPEYLVVQTSPTLRYRIDRKLVLAISPEVRDEPKAFVTLDGSPDLRVARWLSGQWEELCASPCNILLSQRGRYRLQAVNKDPSEMFTLEAKTIQITAHLRNEGQLQMGAVFMALGIGLTTLGVDALAVGARADAQAGALFPPNGTGRRAVGVRRSHVAGDWRISRGQQYAALRHDQRQKHHLSARESSSHGWRVRVLSVGIRGRRRTLIS
jgi:hypothetical protein